MEPEPEFARNWKYQKWAAPGFNTAIYSVPGIPGGVSGSTWRLAGQPPAGRDCSRAATGAGTWQRTGTRSPPSRELRARNRKQKSISSFTPSKVDFRLKS